MIHGYAVDAILGRALRRAIACLVWFCVFIVNGLSGVPAAMAQQTVPPEFHGSWVPVNAACRSPARVQVAAQVLTLINGNDSAAIGGIEMAGPGFFPPGYRGIQAVPLTEFSGHQPATMTFNAGEKKGAAQVEFAPVMPGKGNPQQNAYNARINKLNLAKRFPLHNVPLKKCA